jgi:hypothetical protein
VNCRAFLVSAMVAAKAELAVWSWGYVSAIGATLYFSAVGAASFLPLVPCIGFVRS